MTAAALPIRAPTNSGRRIVAITPSISTVTMPPRPNAWVVPGSWIVRPAPRCSCARSPTLSGASTSATERSSSCQENHLSNDEQPVLAELGSHFDQRSPRLCLAAGERREHDRRQRRMDLIRDVENDLRPIGSEQLPVHDCRSDTALNDSRIAQEVGSVGRTHRVTPRLASVAVPTDIRQVDVPRGDRLPHLLAPKGRPRRFETCRPRGD